MALPPSSEEVVKRLGYAVIPSRKRPNEEYPPISAMLKSNVIQPVQLVGGQGGSEVFTGTVAVTATAARMRASPLGNITLTIKLRALGVTASYVAFGDQVSQDFRLTTVGESIDLDIDPYDVWVISDSAVTPVLEWVATR